MPYIKIKTCRCGCGKPKSLSYGGYNFNCAPQDIKDRVGSKKQANIKSRNARNSTASRIRKVQREVNGDSANELQLWFRSKMNTCPKVCENCGKSLEHYNTNDWFGSQHHIIDKSGVNGCPSVATNPYNHGVLGKWCCHSQWHTSYANAVKMPFFKIAKERFEMFKDKIIQSELKKIPKCFLS